MTQFQYFHTLRRSWPIAVFAALVLILFVPLLALAVTANPENDWHAVLTNATPFILLLLFWIFMMGAMPYRNARKQLAGQSYLREPVTYVFNSETISGTGAGASSTFVWNHLKRVCETKSLFILYHGSNFGVIVPKRFFQNPAEMEKWRQLVLACVAPKRIESPGIVGRWC